MRENQLQTAWLSTALLSKRQSGPQQDNAFQQGAVRWFSQREATSTTDTRDTTECDSLCFKVKDKIAIL